MTITEAVYRIIQEFGIGVVSEKRFLYMLCDYHSFRDNPAEKFICTAIISDDHISKFISANSQEQINFQIDMVVHSISHKYGLKEDLILNVLLNLCKGIPDFSNNYKKGPLPIHKVQNETNISNVKSKGKRKIRKFDTPLIINLKCIIRQLLYGKNIDEVMKEHPNLTLRDRVYNTIINSDILNKRGIIKREIVNDVFLLVCTARLDKIIDIIFPENEIYLYE